MVDNLLYQFGRYVLDDINRILTEGGERIHLSPKPFEILWLLLSRPGRTITRAEFLDTIWPDACVEEANITQHIAALRKVLGDSSRRGESRYIETVTRSGYRFVARVKFKRRPEYRIEADEQPKVVPRGSRALTDRPDHAAIRPTNPTVTDYFDDRPPAEASKVGCSDLTKMELDVLRMIGEKKTSKAIAAGLCVAAHSVDKCRASIREKLGVHGPNALLIFALEHRSELAGTSFEVELFSRSRRAEE